MKNYKLLILLFYFQGASASDGWRFYSQQYTTYHSSSSQVSASATRHPPSPHVVRRPSQKKIDSYKLQREFIYARSLQPVENVWQRLWLWIVFQVEKLLMKTSYNYFWKPLFYVLIIATAIFVILKLFGVEIRGLFSRNPADISVPYEVVEENIHELNLDELIIQAAERRNYRLAVRYMYLKVLKQLSDSSLIDWKPGKTNRMYAIELSKNELRMPFEYLTTQFEYVWYGEFEVNDNSYEKVRNKFAEFKVKGNSE